MIQHYTISDGKLVLHLEPAEEGGYVVTSPLDPELITEAETIEEAFTNAREASNALQEAREKNETGSAAYRQADVLAKDRIEQLYDELAALNCQQALGPEDAERRAQIRDRLARLRQLQEREAAEIRRYLSQNTALPMNTAERLLTDATELIRSHENPAAGN
jgi:antitoxin HicB